MTPYTESMMDVLLPPNNRWLKQLSHKSADVPEGVYVARFNNEVDDFNEDGPGKDGAAES